MPGIPFSRELSSGAVNPTASPQGQPHRKPHSRTGICIRFRVFPISGISPGTLGIRTARARSMAEKVSFFVRWVVIGQALLCQSFFICIINPKVHSMSSGQPGKRLTFADTKCRVS